jgi:hypothetical protein
VLDSNTSLSAPGETSDRPDLVFRVFVESISFINAENTRFGSTGVVVSSNRLSIGIGSLNAVKLGRGTVFLRSEIDDILRPASLLMLSLDSWITVRRLMSRCVSVLPAEESLQLVTRDDTCVAFVSLWRLYTQAMSIRPLPLKVHGNSPSITPPAPGAAARCRPRQGRRHSLKRRGTRPYPQ